MFLVVRQLWGLPHAGAAKGSRYVINSIVTTKVITGANLIP